MKEIKFRAWDGKHKKMFYDVGFLNGVWTIPNGLKLTTTKNVMQFTGLKDKNRKEIYEGDLVKYSIQGDAQNNPIVADMFNLRLGMENGDPYYRIDTDSLEVIGNLCENSDLLS